MQRFIQVAKYRGHRVSELLDITCDFCAWCVDETCAALVVQEAERQRTEAKAEADHDDELARMRREVRAG